jgi:hypothetical protein
MNKLLKMARKATSILVSLATMVSLSGFGALVPIAAHAQTTSDLQAQIQSLLATISGLQAQLAAMQGGGSASGGAAACTFTRNLTVGSQGNDVKCLQTYLQAGGFFTVAPTGYFGSITKAAVAKWQAANGVSPAAGYFGAISRAKYTAIGGNTPPPPPPPGPSTSPSPSGSPMPTGMKLSVAAGTQPAATLAVQSAQQLPYTAVNLTAGTDGDVQVDSLTVQRDGLANDAAFSGIEVLDENMMPITTVSKTLNSNHQAVLADKFVVKAGMTKTIYLAGNMNSSLTSYAGQVAYLTLVSVGTTAQVTGSLPISGAGHTMNASLAIGSVVLSRGTMDPGNVSPTKEVGTTGYTFAALKATAGSAEDIMWKSIKFNQSGSVSASDLANIKVYDTDGNSYPTMVSSDGKYYVATLGSGIMISKGQSKEVYIKGDIMSGSGRTVDFDLYNYSDSIFRGQTYNYNIAATGTSESSSAHTTGTDAAFFTTQPRYDGDQVTIGAGSLRVEKSNSVAAANIANGAQQIAIGAFTFEAKGEPISFTSWALTIATTDNDGGAEQAKLSNFTVVDSAGNAVAGPKDPSSGVLVTFTDTITVPVGSNVYTVKANLNNNWENNDTIIVSFTPSSGLSSVRGQTTGNTLTPTPANSVAANTMTVKAGGVTISPASSFASQSIVTGSTKVELGRYTIDATASGEDVKITTAQIRAITSASLDIDEISGFQLYDGTTALNTGSNVVNPSGNSDGDDVTLSFTLDSPGLLVTKGTSKTLSLFGNPATSVGTSDTLRLDFSAGSPDWSVTGMSTNASISETLTSSSGATITFQTGGGYSVAVAPSAPLEKWYAAGSQGVTLNVLRFTATTEDIAVTDLRLQVDLSGSSTAADYAKVYLYDGATLVTSKTLPSFTNGVEDFTMPSSGTGSFIIPKDSFKELTIKADLAAIGSSQSGTAGQLVGLDYDGTNYTTRQKGLGKASGRSIHSSTNMDQNGNGIVYFRSVPTLARLPIPVTQLTSGTQVLYKFQVTADPAYDIAVRRFAFQVSTTSITALNTALPNFTLRNVTDGNKRMSAATGSAAEFFTDPARYNSSGALVFAIVADTTDYSTAFVPIPAGQTHVFELRGDITTDGSGDSVTAKLLGDNARPRRIDLVGSDAIRMQTVNGLAGTDGVSDIDLNATASSTAFFWSDYSADATSTHSITTHDWMNGFKVPGLLSTGLDASTLSN